MRGCSQAVRRNADFRIAQYRIPNPDKAEIRHEVKLALTTKFASFQGDSRKLERNPYCFQGVRPQMLNFQMFKTIILLLDMGFAFMSFEFGKFGHCFGFAADALKTVQYSDFEFNILIFI